MNLIDRDALVETLRTLAEKGRGIYRMIMLYAADIVARYPLAQSTKENE